MENQVPSPPVNLPTPGIAPASAATTQPLVQPSMPLPTQKPNRISLILGVGIASLVLLILAMTYLFWNSKPKLLTTGESLPRDPEVGRVDNPPVDYKDPVNIDSSQLQTYESSSYGFKLMYPSSWQIDVQSLSQGTRYEKFPLDSQLAESTSSESSQLSTSLISILAQEGPGEVVVLSKGQDWHVVLFAQREFTPGSCGGESYEPGDPYDPEFYTTLSVNNRKVFRPALEKGALNSVDGSSIPTPQYIQAFEPSSSDAGTVVKLPYCIETTNGTPLRLTITYNSPTFVASNFNFTSNSAAQLDEEVLKEMDFIVESIQY